MQQVFSSGIHHDDAAGVGQVVGDVTQPDSNRPLVSDVALEPENRPFQPTGFNA